MMSGTFIFYQTSMLRVAAVTENLLLLEKGGTVSSVGGVEKGAIPFKNSPHSIPFFGNFQLLNGSSRLTPFVAFDHATRILCC